MCPALDEPKRSSTPRIPIMMAARRLRKRLLMAASVTRSRKEFDEADTNHDGYVTLDEAKAYYAGKEGPPR